MDYQKKGWLEDWAAFEHNNWGFELIINKTLNISFWTLSNFNLNIALVIHNKYVFEQALEWLQNH